MRDALGSVRAEVTDAGVIAKAFRYAAYGEIVQPNSNTPTLLGFAGELRDPSGLIYLRARWYDPGTGRFTSRDPFLGDAVLPRSLNPLTYAGANPIQFMDPSGRCVPWCSGAAIGAVSYVVGLGIVNVIVKRQPLSHALDSFTWQDLAISTAAGLVTGGVSSVGWSTLRQVGFSAVVGFDATGVSMLASGRTDPLELAIGTVAGRVGALVPAGSGATGFVRAAGSGGLISAAQTWLTEDGIPLLQRLFQQRVLHTSMCRRSYREAPNER